jgi:outer membrane protein assembly factor BamD
VKLISALFLCSVLGLFSCASGKKSLRDQKGTFLETVKLNYEAGMEALKNEDYEKAIGYFQYIKSKSEFSVYVALSDLRIADAKFAQKKWLDAASFYEVFIRLHPRHEERDFAFYRVGVSYFHAIPSDFFLLPPATSRDQTFTKEALKAIERFLLKFPESKYQEDARKIQVLLFSYLAKHNQQIADYYRRRGRYQAAIDRLLEVETLYPETIESAESLFLAAQIKQKNLKDIDGAKDLYAILIEKKPDSPYAQKAQAELDKISDL